MLATDITLAGDSSSLRTYSLRSIVDGNSVRGASTAPLDQPETLSVKHQTSTKESVVYDRHLIRFDLGKIHSVTGRPVNISIQTVVEVPRDSSATVAMVRDIRTQLVNFMSNANLDKVLAREP